MDTEWSVDPSLRRCGPYRGKRALDLALVLLASPFWLPLLATLAALVRWKLGSPIFFRQQRPGLHARPFELLKFRTMSDARRMDGTLRHDEERLTPFGRRLRATSLDELPELLNVLRGDMSLVGPRPLLLRYLPLYSPMHQGRHRVPPGLTGLAQVMGRNELSWPSRFDLDVRYVRENSLVMDLGILLRTLLVVARREGISGGGEVTMSGFTGYERTPER